MLKANSPCDSGLLALTFLSRQGKNDGLAGLPWTALEIEAGVVREKPYNRQDASVPTVQVPSESGLSLFRKGLRPWVSLAFS